MIITDLEARLYNIPLESAMTDAVHGEHTHFEVVLVKLATNEGLQGIGYTYTIGYGGAAICSLIDLVLKPLLLGSDPRSIEQLWEKMWWKLHYIGRGGLPIFAISAVDIALWDLKGHQQGEPLWRLLGGEAGSAKAYAGGIDLHLSTDDLLKQTEANLKKGFRAIKMKVGYPELRKDVARVKAVRELIGPDIPLMVDANMRWTVETAIRAAQQFRAYDVYWLEEPTIPDDFKGHRRISQEGSLPVATGENLHTIYEFQHMIEVGGIAFPEPDVSNIGGITNWMRVAKLAYAHNLPVTSHGVHELHLHLLAAIPNPSYLEVHSFGLERFIHNPPPLYEGVMTASDRPGHGSDFDWVALDAHRKL